MMQVPPYCPEDSQHNVSPEDVEGLFALEIAFSTPADRPRTSCLAAAGHRRPVRLAPAFLARLDAASCLFSWSQLGDAKQT